MVLILQQTPANTRTQLRSSKLWLILYRRTAICTYSAQIHRVGRVLRLRNSLLDIGPNAEGEIITPMAENLLDAGKWLDYAGECVFDTVCSDIR